ncbi:MAG TPA: hypothetical protein VFO16_24150 [Pseudonocardiaceae bacterium]|nr:hypothetical protein [Pseudonocardiaceae bacterium]
MSEPAPSTRRAVDLMNVVAAGIHSEMRAGLAAGLSRDDVALAGLIAVFSVIRVDNLDEHRLLALARRAVPFRDSPLPM